MPPIAETRSSGAPASEFGLDAFDDGGLPVLAGDLALQSFLTDDFDGEAASRRIGGRDENADDFSPCGDSHSLLGLDDACCFVRLDDGEVAAHHGDGRMPDFAV